MAKCWKCGVVEIPEPEYSEYCCSGKDCVCHGLPVEPPFCKECWEEMYERSYKGGKEQTEDE